MNRTKFLNTLRGIIFWHSILQFLQDREHNYLAGFKQMRVYKALGFKTDKTYSLQNQRGNKSGNSIMTKFVAIKGRKKNCLIQSNQFQWDLKRYNFIIGFLLILQTELVIYARLEKEDKMNTLYLLIYLHNVESQYIETRVVVPMKMMGYLEARQSSVIIIKLLVVKDIMKI